MCTYTFRHSAVSAFSAHGSVLRPEYIKKICAIYDILYIYTICIYSISYIAHIFTAYIYMHPYIHTYIYMCIHTHTHRHSAVSAFSAYGSFQRPE